MKVKIGPYRAKKGQKVEIRIDKWDTWGMYTTLAKIILPMLIQLKATKHGIPGDFVGDDSKEAFAIGEAAWDLVLDRMIWSFAQIVDDEIEHEYFFHPFKKDAYKAYNAHIQEGLELFGKYFRNLWD